MMFRRFLLAGVLLALVGTACSSTSDTQNVAPPNDTATTQPTTQPAAQPTTQPTSDPTPATNEAAAEFGPLNVAEGFGFLRVLTLEERPNALDVVIYETLPNELPRVAGVITTVAQTPLSHVNLRAVQDGVPNAYIEDALVNPAVTDHLNGYVRYTVTTEGFTIQPATQAEVEAHHASSRPTEPQTPVRDLSVTTITSLAQIGFEDWTAYGVKAANLATLGSLDLPDVSVPEGFAVPFSFYDNFMTSNGFYADVRALLADPEFGSDPTVQEEQLAALRDAIKAAPMSDTALAQLTELQESFPATTSLRCRSSTNNEDLPNFSGAGLYDSRTQHPDEGHMEKCIKQVYASVWNLRAFLERDFYRIDHLETAMAVLVHPNFEDEQANGVAVSFDPVFATPNVYYVNTQLGEDLVTNPDALSIPEALLVQPGGAIAGQLTRSNQVEPGANLMTDAQLTALAMSLTVIEEHFAVLYGAQDRDQFAMEVEFKITASSELVIKQARTWIFGDDAGS